MSDYYRCHQIALKRGSTSQSTKYAILNHTGCPLAPGSAYYHGRVCGRGVLHLVWALVEPSGAMVVCIEARRSAAVACAPCLRCNCQVQVEICLLRSLLFGGLFSERRCGLRYVHSRRGRSLLAWRKFDLVPYLITQRYSFLILLCRVASRRVSAKTGGSCLYTR